MTQTKMKIKEGLLNKKHANMFINKIQKKALLDKFDGGVK